MQGAIILDGELKSALSAVRALGEARVAVSAGSERGTGMALHSRYADHTFTYPSPYTDEEGFIRAVRGEAVRMGGKPVVFAFSDVTYLALYSHRDELAHDTTLVFPPSRSIEIAFDKAATYSLAKVSGVPTIPTYQYGSTDELSRLLPSLQYPCVVKPRQSVSVHNGKRMFDSAHFVHSKEELMDRFATMTTEYGETPLVQERVIGEEYGVEMIAHEGKPLATVVHHRIRSLSPTGGASVLKEIVGVGTLRDQLTAYGHRLVGELAWEGPIMVEFKVDAVTMTPRLMEVNGRFWGSLPLSICAGVNMPYLYYLLLTNGEVTNLQTAPREGVVTRHTLGDMRHLLSVWLKRDAMRPHAYPSRMSALRSFFHLPNGTQSDVWSWRDPLPAFYEVCDTFSRLRRT